MIRMLIAISLFFLGLTSSHSKAAAQDKKEPALKEKPGPSLKRGDPAPPLTVTKWLRGEEVKKFEQGKIYVVEFWATWCGPCIAAMPDLAALQTRYKNDGVTVIGFTAAGIKNTLEEAAEFVKKHGPGLKYRFAYADDRTTLDAWMTAAGREGIPCTFVVDKAGEIAYIGHPMYLNAVMPKVVSGTANARAIGDEIAGIEAEFNSISKTFTHDPKTGLQALKEFEAKYPLLADFLPSVRAKLGYLPKYGKAGEAKEYAEAMVSKAIARDNRSSLEMVSGMLRLGDGKESNELMAVAVKAAEAVVRIAGEKDALALIDLANTYHVAGDKAKAKEYAGKAISAVEGESASRKKYIEQEAKKLGVEEKGDKK